MNKCVNTYATIKTKYLTLPTLSPLFLTLSKRVYKRKNITCRRFERADNSKIIRMYIYIQCKIKENLVL